MSEFFFVLKSMLITVAVILCMQIKIGSSTLEQRSLQWIRESNAVYALRGVAEGAVAVFHQGWSWVEKSWRDVNSSSRAESGSKWIHNDWEEESD